MEKSEEKVRWRVENGSGTGRRQDVYPRFCGMLETADEEVDLLFLGEIRHLGNVVSSVMQLTGQKSLLRYKARVEEVVRKTGRKTKCI